MTTTRITAGERAGLAITLFMAAASAASAQMFPTDRGQVNERDPVTGYLCVDPACTTLRVPEANCICQKVNPAERELGRLELTCSTRRGGAWVACPVRPRYGTMIN